MIIMRLTDNSQGLKEYEKYVAMGEREEVVGVEKMLEL